MEVSSSSDWMSAKFYRRECSVIIASQKDRDRCCCGLSVKGHRLDLQKILAEDLKCSSDKNWNPSKHTNLLPTDAYGCIDFQGGAHPNKAQYARISHDTKPDQVMSLLGQQWDLELPKLLITIIGGKQNFELQPNLKKALEKGLLKAAKTTGAWVLTGGLNTGVTRHVGDALVSERSPRLRSGRVASIGIAPWGAVENRKSLVQRNQDIPYHSVDNPQSRFSALNNRHAYFLLVDNGTVGKYGAELALRRKIEKVISIQKLNAGKSRKTPYYTHCSTPLVCLVIEGGTNTIRSVLEYVTSSPPVPVVIFDGTGRAADLLAFAHRYMSDDGEVGFPQEMFDELIGMIQKTFSVDTEQAEQLLKELVTCVKKRNLITVYRCCDTEQPNDENTVELDHVILTALFKSEHLTPAEQLSLALTWNREDIARTEIFKYGVEWDPEVLEQAMEDALINDRVAFVRILLENGVDIKKFLTIERLEELYNCKQGPANTLRFLVQDVLPKMPKNYRYSLLDIGHVINKLIGGGYRSTYSRRRFRHKYCQLNSSMYSNKRSSIFTKSFEEENKGKFRFSITKDENIASTRDVNDDHFETPYSEMMLWAVLTRRQDMAMLMWQHGEEAIAKALVAMALNNAMAYEAEDDDLDVEIYEEFIRYSNMFQECSYSMLEYCYQQDDHLAKQLLTASLENWSRQTCLSLAVLANNRKFLAHPLSQIILGDLWMGGLRMRKNHYSIILGLLIPLTIAQLEFKTKEELELMPQTEEEYLVQVNDDDETSGSSFNDLSVSDVESIGGRSYYRQKSMSKTSLHATYPDNDESKTSSLPLIGGTKRKMRPLKWKKRLYEFYRAPITKYYSHFIAYLVFLGMYTYICLVKTPPVPSIPEIFVTAYVATYGLEKIRQFCALEPNRIGEKFTLWMADSKWNILDVGAIFIFLVGFCLRWDPSTRAGARVTYCTIINYFFIRILKFLAVTKYFGPVVAMMYRMVKNMLYFIVLLLVVLVSFGVCQQSIKYPNEDWNWRLLRHVFYQPYFMLYGEVYAPDIDPECNPDCTVYGECGEASDGSLMVPCHPGRWVTPIAMTLYLLAANILILNLLIAVFNNIYQQVNAISHEVWNFQRYGVVMEYEEKPSLPPPFIILSHLWRFVRMMYRIARRDKTVLESGLKLFLSKSDLERMYDFEEECMEGYIRKIGDQVSPEETDKVSKKIDMLSNSLLRLERKTNELSLAKLEELCEQTANHLAVIHRFMARYTESLSEKQCDSEENERIRQSATFDRGIRTEARTNTEDPFKTEKSTRHLKSPSPFDRSANSSPTRKFTGFGNKPIKSRPRHRSAGSDYLESERRKIIGSDEHSVHSNISDERHANYIEKFQPTHNLVINFSEQDATHEHTTLQQQTSQHTENTSHSSCKHDPNILRAYNRQQLVNTRDYTSITDQLEVLLPTSWNMRREENTLPAVQVEADMLKDAEDDDYNLFESVIERRLRRDSTNLHSSMEELITKSIRDDSSSDESEPRSPKYLIANPHLLKRGQSRIRTRKSSDKRNLAVPAITEQSSKTSTLNDLLVKATRDLSDKTNNE
eukprot:GFUD01023599.1.p1 GENE.GFUD01023599.1~~GFUD01023599.1.p1  ORF type:complete len:1565 (-),score=309.61 GFUD01023599.1:400-5094(-)